jgi:hypothetical protein
MKEQIEQVLNEAIDALGDIPAEHATEQQKEAYRLCVRTRDTNLKASLPSLKRCTLRRLSGPS